MKLFRKLLNTTVLNALILYLENKTRNGYEQLSNWVQLVEDLFIKYRTVLEYKVPGNIHLIM